MLAEKQKKKEKRVFDPHWFTTLEDLASPSIPWQVSVDEELGWFIKLELSVKVSFEVYACYMLVQAAIFLHHPYIHVHYRTL